MQGLDKQAFMKVFSEIKTFPKVIKTVKKFSKLWNQHSNYLTETDQDILILESSAVDYQ